MYQIHTEKKSHPENGKATVLAHESGKTLMREVPPDFARQAAGAGMLRRRGRGALGNASGRFEKDTRSFEDDGWDSGAAETDARTEVAEERARSLITHNDSPDISFDRSVNPYRGCEHGCIYCYARPTHPYLGLSAGLDFETRLFAKTNAAEVLARELSARGYVPRTIAIGTNTDPYQPIERRLQVMRQILEVLSSAGHPVGIVTKSALVLRDLDILAPMASKGLVKVAVSVTTLDPRLARTLEPRASAPSLRLDALRGLAEAGIPTAVMVAPIIPGLTDHEIEAILARAAAMGAREAGYVMLRLPLEVGDLFTQWLATHVPEKRDRVLGLLRSMRGGKISEATFGKRMTGSGPYAWMIGRRFEAAVARSGLTGTRMPLRTDLFVAPGSVGRTKLPVARAGSVTGRPAQLQLL
jgi:DNA repair photolyase